MIALVGWPNFLHPREVPPQRGPWPSLITTTWTSSPGEPVSGLHFRQTLRRERTDWRMFTRSGLRPPRLNKNAVSLNGPSQASDPGFKRVRPVFRHVRPSEFTRQTTLTVF